MTRLQNTIRQIKENRGKAEPCANYGHLEIPQSKPYVVPIDIIPDHSSKQPDSTADPADIS